MEEIEERWLPGYEGCYSVTNMGQVYSHKRNKKIPLKLIPNPKGYYMFTTSMNNYQVQHYVHQAVARAFIGERPDKMDVCHNNGNKQDNRLSNLRYDTRINNCLDTVLHARARRKHGK